MESLCVLPQEWQVCQATVGVLGDVCRAIEDQIAPYTETIMTILLHNLESADVQRNIKPQILSAFGDIALAIGDRFEACVNPCLHMLQSAQVTPSSIYVFWGAQSSLAKPHIQLDNTSENSEHACLMHAR